MLEPTERPKSAERGTMEQQKHEKIFQSESKTELRERISRYFDEHRDAIIRDIAALIDFPTIEENHKDVLMSLKWMLDLGRAAGLRADVTSGGVAGHIEIGEGDECVGILAHVDVVGVGDPQKWGRHDPFKLAYENGLIFGRGVVDDKGPAVISLYSLKFLKESGFPLKKRIRLIIGTSEESGWTDMAEYRKEFGSPDYGYSPDGDFPISNVEKGYCDAKLYFTGDFVKGIERLSAGDSPNTVPSHAAIKRYGGGERLYFGKAVHSSTPWLGDNAIIKLAMDNLDLPFCRFIKEYFLEQYHGTRLGIDDGSDSYDGVFVSKTTATPTVLRLTDSVVMLNINIRTHVGSGRGEIERALAAHAESCGYSFKLDHCSDPLMVSPDLPFMRDMQRLYEEYGFRGGFQVAEGASYAGTMNNCVCWGPIFPGEYSCAHEEDEQIIVDSLLKAAKLYTEFLCVTAGA